MGWRVEFLPAADKAFGKLDRQQQRRIRQFIETRLQTAQDPHRLGKACVGPLKTRDVTRLRAYFPSVALVCPA